MITLKANGVIHHEICKNEDTKQKLIEELKKIELDILPFKLILSYPNYVTG